MDREFAPPCFSKAVTFVALGATIPKVKAHQSRYCFIRTNAPIVESAKNGLHLLSPCSQVVGLSHSDREGERIIS